MDALKKINVFRKVLTKGLTKNIGRLSRKNNTGLLDIKNIKRVLICRPNHRLGNMMLITPLLQEVEETFPGCTIDLFVKGNLVPVLFKNYAINNSITLPKKHFKQLASYIGAWVALKRHRYDLVINVDGNSSSGRLSTGLARANHKVFGNGREDVNRAADYDHMAKFPVYNLRDYLSGYGVQSSNKKVPDLNIKLSNLEIAEGKAILHKLKGYAQKTICIYTYATGHKCYSEYWWGKFYEQLQHEYPDYMIIEILPVENVSQIAFKAPAFYSKDIRTIAAVIANTAVFIGGDCGIMHLASSAGVPVVGLFSATNHKKYGPYNGTSISIDTSCSTNSAIFKVINDILKQEG